ncbi:MAG TPA: cyanophycin synthetase [Vitreimonas sp.]|uniref:bifunctional folylpolyglutamate synthase/dihydrofolate synthase n=1 Tax=Vitreimonas sp. TaxID=3069702 RepID=UPI002D22F597|nr:cyanophycin synthetase [Vitreimonas sp.]HYD88285.1 cyanophycin synthetase [Vitreimonas sp.]
MRPWRAPFPKFGVGPGLARVDKAARALGIDLTRFGETGAVIVGSNGKGSTAAMTAALLQQTGRNVGLFTSPHLLDLNERFRLNGDDIADEELEAHWERVLTAVRSAGEQDNFGAFEFLFLVAAVFFAANDCAHTVWEAGIGGRLDPVRLIRAPRLALTSLDLEHTDLLGDTLEAIARDKLDAARAGAKVFYGESCNGQRAVIESHCATRGIEPVLVSAIDQAPLPGGFQAQNAALALALARDIAVLSPEQTDAGFAATRWPGRLEIIDRAPLTVIDVGHTPAGVRAALDGFNEMRSAPSGVLVLGVSLDKGVAEIVGVLAPAFEAIICVAARHKGAPPAQIAARAAAANPSAEIAIAESVEEARRLALSEAGEGGVVYVAGGLFLAAEYKAVHSGRDPASLVFF